MVQKLSRRKRPGPTTRIAPSIGRDGAARLCQIYSASTIIPLAFANGVRNRVHDVRVDLILASGCPTKMAAATYCDITRPE
jgi:glycosyltransferase A (GT-A) superfamily protein (DUF2064 family)